MIERYQNLEPDLKRMVLMSLAFHAAIVLVFTVKTAFFPSDIPKYEPAIRVDLVGLPNKRNPDTPLTAPTPTPAPEPVKETKPESKTVKEEKKTVPAKNSTTQSAALNKLKSLSAIEKLKDMKEEKTEVAEAKPQSDVIKGNVLSVGTALKGLNKLEFDQYIGSLDVHVKNNWALPEWMLTQGLKAEVLLKIDKSGQIIERKFIKKSGNTEFDDRVMAALEKSNPFPAPPEKFIDLVGIQGITFAFPD